MTTEQKEMIFKRISDVFVEAGVDRWESKHGPDVLENLLKLNPEASAELQIAALAHDIDRGFERENRPTREQFPGNYDAYKAAHANRSSEIIEKLLEEYDFLEKGFIDRVRCLVLNHEVGGDDDANDLRDADSMAFMMGTGSSDGYMKIRTKQQSLDKLDWMFVRMSEKNKAIAKPLYEDRLKKIKGYYL